MDNVEIVQEYVEWLILVNLEQHEDLKEMLPSFAFGFIAEFYECLRSLGTEKLSSETGDLIAYSVLILAAFDGSEGALFEENSDYRIAQFLISVTSAPRGRFTLETIASFFQRFYRGDVMTGEQIDAFHNSIGDLVNFAFASQNKTLVEVLEQNKSKLEERLSIVGSFNGSGETPQERLTTN